MIFIKEQKESFKLYFWKENDNTINISLFDANDIVGYIKLQKNKDKGYSVRLVAADRGYGIYLYYISGGIVYPKPITSDRWGGTNFKAKGVLRKLQNSPIVQKENINVLSGDYIDSNEEYLNQYFYIKPNSFVKNLVLNANKGGHKIDEVKKRSLEFFDKKYLNSD
jgi:hypothetical protein